MISTLKVSSIDDPRPMLQSLVSTLEFAGQILDRIPLGTSEIEDAQLKVNEALVACLRLKLEGDLIRSSNQ